MAKHPLKTYDFTLVLANLAELTDIQANALFRAGCDDATPVSRDSRVLLHFAREADSLEHAIRSAIADVARSGLRAAHVEMECPV
ncbi:MAG: hypothetical protein NTY19_38075 [Planctomycetota bacterium]|nr:hypothetical protein [Planctomycetota bacterium]